MVSCQLILFLCLTNLSPVLSEVLLFVPDKPPVESTLQKCTLFDTLWVVFCRLMKDTLVLVLSSIVSESFSASGEAADSLQD